MKCTVHCIYMYYNTAVRYSCSMNQTCTDWKAIISFCLALQRGLAVHSRLDCKWILFQLAPPPFLLLPPPPLPHPWLGSGLAHAPWLCCPSSLLCRLWRPFRRPSCWPCSVPQPAWPSPPRPRAFLVEPVRTAALQPGQSSCRSPADLSHIQTEIHSFCQQQYNKVIFNQYHFCHHYDQCRYFPLPISLP